MDHYIWRLLTAMFLLLTAAVLGLFVFLFEGATFMVGICFYGALICGLTGIGKGLIVISDYHKEHKEQE